MKIHTLLVLVLVSLLKNSLGQTGCPTGWFSFQSKCIIAVEGQVTYSDAMDMCANDTNGELLVAEPYSLYQNFIANTLLPGTTSLYFYIGLDKIDSADFVWIGDIVPSEFFWGPNQPFTGDSSQDCVAAQNDGSEALWFDFTCATLSGYICQRTVDLFCGSGSACQNGGTCAEGLTGSICSCTAGRTGDMCEIDIDECSTNNPCSPQAICQDTSGSYLCMCMQGYEGDGLTCTDLDECSLGTHDCLFNTSTCVNNAGSFECSCRTGYMGNPCTNIDECSRNEDNCATEADCVDNEGSFTCICMDGYNGNGLTCTDIDECSTSMDDCPEDSTCMNSPGSYTCVCSEGRIFNPVLRQCDNEDECARTPSPCHANANCMDLDPLYTCTCQSGFDGDGVNDCSDIDECDSSPCGTNAMCQNMPGSFTCNCPTGFSGDAMIECTDVNECETMMPCDTNAACANNAGSYTCTCIDGYEGDGETCTDVDECASNPCGTNEMCNNQINSYTCVCQQGFTRVDDQCMDMNECDDPEICGANQMCINSPGTYTCSCSAGYEVNLDGNCVDMDECSSGSPCDANAACNNTVGSYTCECNSGYSGNGRICNDIDECLSNTDDCAEPSFCVNTGGSFECRCNAGFEMVNGVCEDINECDSNPCSENEMCIDGTNFIDCTCLPGFVRGADQICTDFDECSNPTICDVSPNQVCMNNEGSYECTCASGYNRDGSGLCEDINECIPPSPCGTNEDCDNTPGSYSCECQAGFLRDDFENCVANGNPCPRRAIVIEQQDILTPVEWKTPIIHTTSRGKTVELKQESPLGSGRLFPVGLTELIYSADEALCRFWVIVKEIETTLDVTPPTIYDCPESPLEYVINTDQISIKPNWTEPFAIDDTGLPVQSQSSHSSGDPLEVGTTNVIFNFTDSADNFVQCIFIISVIETDETVPPPEILFCPTSIRYDVAACVDEVSITWEEPIIENAINAYQTHFPGEFFKIGTTEVTYTAVNSVDKEAVCRFNVDVRDVIPPRIFLCPSDKSVRACRGSTTVMWLEPYACAEDNSGLQVEQTQSHIPGVSLFKEGITTVNYQFEDIFGNAAVCSFNITVHRNSCQYFTQEELNLCIYIVLGLLIFVFVILIGVNCYIYKASGTSSDNNGINLSLQDLTTA